MEIIHDHTCTIHEAFEPNEAYSDNVPRQSIPRQAILEPMLKLRHIVRLAYGPLIDNPAISGLIRRREWQWSCLQENNTARHALWCLHQCFLSTTGRSDIRKYSISVVLNFGHLRGRTMDGKHFAIKSVSEYRRHCTPPTFKWIHKSCTNDYKHCGRDLRRLRRLRAYGFNLFYNAFHTCVCVLM